MIKDQWYAVLDSKELKVNKPRGYKRMGENLVFWRNNRDEINCIIDKCCHRGAALSGGKIVDDNIECPFHGFQYDNDGKVKKIPANGREAKIADNFKVRSYLAKEAYGLIWLWYSESKDDALEIPFFEDLKEGFSYGGFSETWPVHYTRAVENQLDVVHLPFVHKTTIGKGGKELVNGPVVKWQDNLMTFYVKNEKDEGQVPRKPEEIEDYEKLFSLQFQMPNTWQNIISDKVRVFAAFVPIDEENTQIYLRFYQKFAKVFGVKQMVNQLTSVTNKIILHQDRDVVIRQLPIKSELKMGENLIQGDLPIIEFRKRRSFLKGENQNL